VLCAISYACTAGITHAVTTIVKTEGPLALYKGLAPTLLGIAPYAALNFALYDLAKKYAYSGNKPQNPIANLAVGGLTGTIAASVCYPLDTVRRQMQMKGNAYKGQLHAMQMIWKTVCPPGFLPCSKRYNGLLLETAGAVIHALLNELAATTTL
jgi:solute carrier family 25 (mitochondrial phosphate transporter), member 23/24/25/41